MNRDRPIVYLATEGSSKCILGLKEILEDGWNVRLVIAYIARAEGKVSPLSRLRALVSTVKRAVFNVFRVFVASTQEHQPVETLDSICHQSNVAYQATSDKSLGSHRLQIENVAPDVILSNGWQFHISAEIISLAKLIALNCHSSYLPEYRGGNVTYAPLINEERQSGVTVHELVDKFDAGAILAQARVSLDENETPRSLKRKRAEITGKVLIEALEIAGSPHLYKPNPISPFYFRCNRGTYNRYRRLNYWRKLLGLPVKRYEPRERYDI